MTPEDQRRLARVDRYLRIIGRDINAAIGAALGYLVYKMIEPSWGDAWAFGAALVIFLGAGYFLNRELERE